MIGSYLFSYSPSFEWFQRLTVIAAVSPVSTVSIINRTMKKGTGLESRRTGSLQDQQTFLSEGRFYDPPRKKHYRNSEEDLSLVQATK